MKHLARVGLLLLGVWLILFGAMIYWGWSRPIVTYVLHLYAMGVGAVFLFSLFAMERHELPGMLFLGIFLFAVGVLPFETIYRLGLDSPVGVILWAASLVAGFLILLGFKGKDWWERLGFLFLSVWLIVWPLPLLSGERRIALLFGAFLPTFSGLFIAAYSLFALLSAGRNDREAP